ncbi:LIM and calponin homology domains-containing protein 1a isoform X6 [Entelurus aequoreus]|uniref:LIM and calponin homology domains-containing protein 1a isoform X6 n=1 Tax=Entelurus aequoreus TaxID=161455 RepID=UPI002B1D9E25|nr:LIM and calponin homology domains-containing protein 1a isoform X6 [Entelurus aequoreus]
MASQAADRDVRPGCVESTSHPEPACREAQKWIEAVTGKSFGDKDFRSALENGILLCELLSAIRPGLVKKINRLPTPIAGLDNLSVFLRGCEQLGLKGSQLFDPGDLQDTSMRANLKDSDCTRKLKNVLNTMFWLGKAARGCASYSGPTLNLKEFEGLLAQMKMDSEESADGSQKRSVRDSGYDCWDSERSESLSPPRHTRDNSLDSLDSFGSRSQHSPSPDVANRSNTDGRASDLEADAAGRKPDVQKDDMSARRSASGESRSSIPFNQFLPNRSNASSYVLNPRRKSHVEDGEQRSLTDGGPHCETTSNLSPGAPEAPRSPAELDACLEKRMEEEQEEEENEEERTPDVRKDDMMARRTGVFHKQSASAASYNHFLPLPASKRCPRGEVGSAEVDWMKNGNVRGARDAGRDEIANVTVKQEHVDDDDDGGDGGDENEPVPVLEKDDMMARRTGAFHKSNLAFRHFLPVPGALKYNATTHAPAVKQAKLAEKVASESSGVGMVTQRQTPPPEPCPKKCVGLEEHKGDSLKAPASLSSPSLRSEAVLPPCREAELGSKVARAEERMEESKKDDAPRKKAFWVEDDLPPIMVSRRVALMSEDAESVSLSDIVNEDEAGHLPHALSVSRHERMHEQYNSFQEEDDQWRSDLARWKTRRRCTSQELIKKEEERKRMERMKEEGGDCNKRKSIKTYKEIVEDKERREAELCEAYRNAATPEEAAMVLQRYALRFTISDATLDYLKLPRSTSDPEEALNQAPHTQEAVNEMLEEPASTEEESMKCEEIKTVTLDTFSDPLTPTGTLHSPENTSKEFNQRPIQTRPEQLIPVDAPSQSRTNPPEVIQVQPPTVKPVLTIPSPSSAPSRPVPLLAAKPYCQPRSSHGVKMDGLVRINGDSPASPSEKKDLFANEASSLDPESVPEMPDKSPTPLQASSSSSSSSSFSSSSSTISSLFSGRNCITKTTIVTELTQTVVEPQQLEVDDQVINTTTLEKAAGEQPARSPSLSLSSTISIPEYSPTVTEGLEESSVSIETPMLNLAKRVNHWVWDPNEERKRVERWQQEQERLLQEQYQKEQEKLKKEWEKAQLEVREQERKHNEEERRILEETVVPLSPGVLVQQQLVHPGTASPASHDGDGAIRNLIHQQNGQKEDQHVSKLHFLQDSSHDSDPCKKQDMWKTTSLDRNLQPNLPQGVKRCDSHEGITAKQQQLPPSPTRCVSGKRLCSGCSQPLGKGAAMIIDTLGLFFHMQCFKCGLCEGQLGDATTGTDVRIRNGLLTCHDCYISSRGRGQPTTL